LKVAVVGTERCISGDIKFTGPTDERLIATSLRSRIKVKPPVKDALDVGTVSFGTALTIVDPGWEVIPPEDIFVKKKLKAKVQKAIDEAVKAILAGEESSQEDENSNQEEVNARIYRDHVSHLTSLPFGLVRRQITVHATFRQTYR